MRFASTVFIAAVSLRHILVISTDIVDAKKLPHRDIGKSDGLIAHAVGVVIKQIRALDTVRENGSLGSIGTPCMIVTFILTAKYPDSSRDIF